jgi:putative membrane protein
MAELPPLAERAALARTRLALERTLMAWLRTAISMITFGFTLFKAMEYARELGLKASHELFGTSSFAVVMMIMGLASLILATIQHLRHARTIRTLDAEMRVLSPASLLALMFTAVGLFALVTVILGHRRPG